jgi:Ca-activated chloride channel homolog
MTNRLSLQTGLEHPRITAGGAVETHAVITLTAHGGAIDTVRPRLTVVFVLDISGSMSGEPLSQVKDSVERLCALLPSTDQVGIVAFGSNATVVAEVQPLDQTHKAVIRRRLGALHTSGSTHMTSGVAAGLAAFPPRGPDERQLLVLLTDGAPTDGSTGESLGALVEARRDDIAVVTLGYGPNHNADLLAAVARAGRGQYWYIADPAEANVEFARALGAQADIVVDAVELVLAPAAGVEIVSLLDGARPRFGSGGLIVGRPDLRDGQAHTTIVALKLAAMPETGRWPVVEVTVQGRAVGNGARLRDSCSVAVDVIHGAGGVDVDAHRSVALAHAENARIAARTHADAGRFDAAAALLRPVVARLEALPGYRKMDGSAVSEAVEQLVDEIVAYEARPTAQQYLEFKSSQMAVDVAQGGVHAADVKMKSQMSRTLMQGVQGSGGFIVELSERGGPTRVETFATPEITIGRMPGNELVLPVGNVSKRHTRIILRDGKAVVVCLKSTNGTFVNGARITTPRVLEDGDVVAIGNFTLKVRPQP